MTQLFTLGGQSTEASALASALPINIQGWFPLELTSLISLQSKGLCRVFSSITIQKHLFFSAQPSLWSNSLIMTTGKTVVLTMQNFVGKMTSLLFNMLSRFVIVFPPRSMHLLISSTVSIHNDFRDLENKISHGFHFFSYFPWSSWTGCHDLSFLNIKF